MKDVLDQEINWCRANRGISGKGELFEDGFIDGLRQAKNLMLVQRKELQILEIIVTMNDESTTYLTKKLPFEIRCKGIVTIVIKEST